MRKTLLLFFLLGTSIIVGCSSYNDIDFDVESQSLYSPGALKHVEFFSSDKGLEFDYHFDPGDDASRKPLLIRNLRPHKIYRIRNSGGDRGPFTIYLETDSSGRGVRVLEYPDLPHVAMVEQSLSAILKGKLDLAVSMHIDEEKEQGRYLYPDSVVCASVWFDFRGEIDSLYVLSWPIALYEDEFANPEVHFLGFIENNNLLIGIASLGEENPQTISSFVDTTALQINKEQYKSVSDAFMSHLRNLDVCSFLISSSFINSSGLLVPAHTWLR